MDNLRSSVLMKLEGLGLSSNEAEAYVALLEKSPQTGYEVAKRCDLSRGNIYSTLERLVEKEAIQKTLENKYIAVDLQQFLKMRMHYFSDCAHYIENNFKELNIRESHETVFSIFGHSNILSRVREMILSARKQISLVAFEEELDDLKELLIQANKRSVSIHIMAFGNFDLNGIPTVSHSKESWVLRKLKGRFLTIVKDMEEGMIGGVDESESCMASWSKNAHYCMNIQFYIAHEIALTKIFKLLDKRTIQRIHSELLDEYEKVILAGMPNF